MSAEEKEVIPLIQAIILSGGPGSRLYPLSNKDRPKPFMTVRGKSLLRSAYDRVKSLSPNCRPIIVTNKDYVSETLNHLESDVIILAEPCRKDTGPAVCLAIRWHQEHCKDKNVTYLICAADHHIPDTDKFVNYIRQGYDAANDGYIVTFGMSTAKPETGYGYIEKGNKYGRVLLNKSTDVYEVKQFIEKPNMNKAIEYHDSDNYYWNSGMFLMTGSVCIDKYSRIQPDMWNQLQFVTVNQRSNNTWDISQTFDLLPTISFDYAIMEKVGKIAVVLCDMKWSDVGSWNSMWEISAHDNNNNYTKGNINVIDSNNFYVISEDRPILMLGCDNLVVINDGKTILVVNRDDSQRVKELINKYGL